LPYISVSQQVGHEPFLGRGYFLLGGKSLCFNTSERFTDLGKLKLLIFNIVFFLRITTLLSLLKSTLLLKRKCFDTTIYMKTQCLQTNETQYFCRIIITVLEKPGDEEKGQHQLKV